MGLILAQLSEFLAMDAGVLACRPDDAVIPVFDGDGDKSLQLQVGDVRLNLSFTDVEEFGKITVGRVTTALVVERMDFDEQNFFHDGKLLGFPDFLRNPDTFEIS